MAGYDNKHPDEKSPTVYRKVPYWDVVEEIWKGRPPVKRTKEEEDFIEKSLIED